MKKRAIREKGLVATLFHPQNATSAIIVLGGSSGGIPEARAEALASHGFAALALAYFAAESLPSTLKQIPLEYGETAIDFLRREFQVSRIGLWGGSRGAELALLLAATFPDRIGAVAAYVPTSVMYGALDDLSVPTWTYQGQPLAAPAPLPLSLPDSDAIIALTPSFLAGMDDPAFAAAAIPVEKITCPLLLISAQDDQMWPSSLFAQQIVDRLIAHASPIPVLHLSYPDVGHAPSKGTSGFHPILKRWFAYGGTPSANAFAAQDWHEQTIAFLKNSFSRMERF